MDEHGTLLAERGRDARGDLPRGPPRPIGTPGDMLDDPAAGRRALADRLGLEDGADVGRAEPGAMQAAEEAVHGCVLAYPDARPLAPPGSRR